METKQKTAIVTGASKGIGAAIARRLAQDDIAIVVNYSTDLVSAQKLVAELERSGGQAVAAQANVADPQGISSLFDAAEQTFGQPDILINNAGTMQNSALALASDEEFDKQIAVNLAGTFRGMREAANRLKDGGRIISISSSVVGFYQPGYGIYAASKAAVEAMTKVLAKELGTRSITVNAVSPGPVETEFFFAGKSDAQIEAIKRLSPLGRLGAPNEIADAVAYLAGPESGWVNGQILRVNGGAI
ncbi:MAG: SDR family oxidoreductase [Roseibium sp.]|uniref:SDR family oxidoreductase n=1 Tax=Roseibium sp. TaxID=1936156 RepID=UPI00263755BE|nr:SDR family oxidoreductase [Roseibium sp.]MCV0426489.1 SDR family oxidoreductase [Roseibium sp.]